MICGKLYDDCRCEARRITESHAYEAVSKAAVLILLPLMAFAISMMSPLNPFVSNAVPGQDSSVFIYVGNILKRGLMPYKDTFDHKGPLLYLLEYAGLFISEKHGIWAVELASWIVSSAGLYRLSRLSCGRIGSLVTTSIALSLAALYFNGGNMTEEYCLPFQIWAVYIYADYFINGKINTRRLILCGAMLAATALVKLNLIALWAVFSVFVLIKLICARESRKIPEFAGKFTAGFAIVAVPVILWLGLNGALREFYNQYIVFNSMYSSNHSAAVAYSQESLLSETLRMPLVIVSAVLIIAGTVMACRSSVRLWNIAYFLYMISSVAVVCLPGYRYLHYAIILIPISVYPLSMLLGYESKKFPVACLKITVVLFLILQLGVINWIYIADTAVNGEEADQYGDYCAVVQYIRDNSGQDDRITVWGNEDAIYNATGRLSASRYSYQIPPEWVKPEIMNEYIADLEADNPVMIVIHGFPAERQLKEFIADNNYETVFTSGKYIIYAQAV